MSSLAMLYNWVRNLMRPAIVIRDGWECIRVSIGSLLGLAVTGLTLRLLPDYQETAALLLIPMGASTVLLFLAPSSPTAQPRSVLGGNLVAAIVGVACARSVQDTVLAGALAVATSIAVMTSLRCFHPPSGALALVAVLGNTTIREMGYWFVLFPVALQTALLVGIAWLYHYVTGLQYPALPDQPTRSGPDNPAAPPGIARNLTRTDVEAALNRSGEYLDISPEDLEDIFHEVQREARTRFLRELTCADIMSTRVITISPDCSIGDALALLRRNHIKALPVVDADQKIVGVVTIADLDRSDRPSVAASGGARCDHTAQSRRAVKLVMHSAVFTVTTTTGVAQLISMFSTTGHHHIPVVSDESRVVGMVTESDVMMCLSRRHIT